MEDHDKPEPEAEGKTEAETATESESKEPETTEQPTEDLAPAGVLAIAPDIPRLEVPVGAGRVIPAEGAPNYLFLTIVSVFTLGVDIASKNWAEKALEAYPGTISIWDNHAAFILAKNRGGAWGFFQGASEAIRRPFFLLVSAAAIVFIVTLFRRLQPKQHALRWGLPLVMGGALGNVFDRIRYGFVIDFIDVHMQYKGVDHHWPTFNVADIAICVGVGLMAIDMFTSKRGKPVEPTQQAEALPPEGPAPAEDISLEKKTEPTDEKEAAEGS
jgi:signal peptidase II